MRNRRQIKQIVEQAHILYQAGWTYREIAEKFGMSHASLYESMKRYDPKYLEIKGHIKDGKIVWRT